MLVAMVAIQKRERTVDESRLSGIEENQNQRKKRVVQRKIVLFEDGIENLKKFKFGMRGKRLRRKI